MPELSTWWPKNEMEGLPKTFVQANDKPILLQPLEDFPEVVEVVGLRGAGNHDVL